MTNNSTNGTDASITQPSNTPTRMPTTAESLPEQATGNESGADIEGETNTTSPTPDSAGDGKDTPADGEVQGDATEPEDTSSAKIFIHCNWYFYLAALVMSVVIK